MGLLAVMELSRLAPTARGRLVVLGLAVAGIVAVAVLGVGTGLVSAGLRGNSLRRWTRLSETIFRSWLPLRRTDHPLGQASTSR